MKTFKEFIRENHTGNIGGLGFNTGNPAVNSSGVANYVAYNTADSDNKNNILGMKGGKDHLTSHNRVGFKAYNPATHRAEAQGRGKKKKDEE